MDETPSDHDSLPGIRSPAEAREVIGHGQASQRIADARASGRLHHAWLLQGPHGVGKATMAFDFARRMLATPDASPVETAVLARQVANGSHPRLLHLMRPANERGGFKTQITVDEVRRLNRFFQTTSSSGQWRVAIIDPVDDLNRNAANALLKMLEEPPARSLFLIVNHLPGRLLPTVRSRCRLLRFDPLPTDAIVDILASLDVDAPARAIEGAAQRSEGSVRGALMLLAGSGLKVEERLDELLGYAVPEWHGIQALADELAQKGQEAAFDLALVGLLARLARDSEKAAEMGDLARARALASTWETENERFREALLYNLDRRQLLMTHFHKRFA